MYRKEILQNGIDFVSEEIPLFMSASLGIFFKSGSRHEGPLEKGISHLIEHLLFKGTKNRTGKEISKSIDAVGGILNASCGKEFTCFYAKVVDKDLFLALEILSDIILNSLFNPEDIDKERAVILEEIKAIEDSPSDYIFEFYLKSVWDGHPLAIPTSGEKDVLESINREKLMEYFYKNYIPEKMIVSIAGNINHSSVSAFLKENLNDFQWDVKNKNDMVLTPPDFKPGIFINHRDCEQVHFCMGYSGISLCDDRRYAGVILDNIIGGNSSSRLFQKVREELGLVYSIYSFQNSFFDTGLFSFYGATSEKNINEVIKIVINEIDNICSKGITDDELNIAKNYVNGGMILGLESTSNRMFRIAKSELVYNRLLSIDEVLENINSVTKDEVLELAHSIFKRDKLALCLLGPVRKDIDLNVI